MKLKTTPWFPSLFSKSTSLASCLRPSLTKKHENRHTMNIDTPVNAHGLPSLPTEMLLEIMSHTDAPEIPFSNYGPPDLSSLERRSLLLNLSLVCRSLREALLPVLWETIEACTAKGASVFATNVDPKWWKLVSASLSKQLRLVTVLQPSWASHIRTVNVLITPCNADTLVPHLAHALSFMPNLHTFQMANLWWINGAQLKGQLGEYSYSESLFEEAFKGYTFPSVQNVVLPTAAASILACFPEAWSVFQTDAYKPDVDVGHFVSKVAEHCPKVEYFSWAVGAYAMAKISDLEFYFYSQANLHAPAFLTVVRTLPNLRRLHLYTMYHDAEIVNAIEGMKNLDTIEIFIHPNHDTKEHQARWEEMIEAAQRVLEDSPSYRQKTLMVDRASGAKLYKVSESRTLLRPNLR